MDEEQKQGFQDRIARIHERNPSASFGSSEPWKEYPTTAEPERKSILGRILKGFLALGVGLGSVVTGRLVAYQYTKDGVAVDDGIGIAMLFMGDIIIMVVLSIVLSKLFNLYTAPYGFIELFGFVTMMFYEDYYIVMMPELWSYMFSPGYVYDSVAYMYQAGGSSRAFLEYWMQ